MVPMVLGPDARAVALAPGTRDVLTQAVRHVRVRAMQDGRVQIVVAGHVWHLAPGLRGALVDPVVGDGVHGVRFHPLVLAASLAICKDVEKPSRRSMKI